MHSLPLFHRLAGTRVILLGEGEAGAAKQRLLERAGAIPVGEDDGEARLAFLALAEPDAPAQRLRRRGLLLNVADRPDLCDFTVPSILERGPVLVAVGTGGASAGLAKMLRLRLEALLPASLGALAQALDTARGAIRARFPDAADRRRAIDEALGEGGLLDPFRAESAGQVEAWLSGAAAQSGARVSFTITSDDPDDLTLRQARWLGTADLVAYETGISAAILARSRADAARIALPTGAPPPSSAGLVVVIRRG